MSEQIENHELRVRLAEVTKERDAAFADYLKAAKDRTEYHDALAEARAERDKWQTDWELLKTDYQALQHDLAKAYTETQRLKEQHQEDLELMRDMRERL